MYYHVESSIEYFLFHDDLISKSHRPFAMAVGLFFRKYLLNILTIYYNIIIYIISNRGLNVKQKLITQH